MRRVALIVLIVASLVALGGCSAVSTLFDTENALRDAGYQSVSVHASFSGSVSTIDVSVKVYAFPTTGTASDVAGIVWQKFHERFDYLHVTVHGDGSTLSQTYTFDQVQQLFGPRNPSWNRTSVKSAYTDVFLEVVVGVVALGLIIVGIVLLTTRRRRRQRAAGWAGGPGWVPYGPGPGPYGPGPYASGGPGGPYAPSGSYPPAGPYPPGGPPPAAGPPPSGAGYPLWEPPAHPPQSPAPPAVPEADPPVES